jgi:hypothetical protein
LMGGCEAEEDPRSVARTLAAGTVRERDDAGLGGAA